MNVFAWNGWIIESQTLKALNIPFKKVALPGRVKCGGLEGEIVVARLPEKKKLICGMEGEIVMAHGRLPSPLVPLPVTTSCDNLKLNIYKEVG